MLQRGSAWNQAPASRGGPNHTRGIRDAEDFSAVFPNYFPEPFTGDRGGLPSHVRFALPLSP